MPLDTPDMRRAVALGETYTLHLDTLTRAQSLAEERTTSALQQRDRVAQQTAEYLARLGRPDEGGH